MEKHLRGKWFQEGRAWGYLAGFLSWGSPWVFEEHYTGQWGRFLFDNSPARWTCTHVFLKDEFFSACSTERMNVLCFLSWKNQLDSRILILVLSHFSSSNSKSIIHNPLLEIHQKMLHFSPQLHLSCCMYRKREDAQCSLCPVPLSLPKHSLWDV